MSNHELDKLLRSVPVPGREEQYWEEFPDQARCRIRSARSDSSVVNRRSDAFRGKWILGLSLTAAAALLWMLFQQAPSTTLRPDTQLDALRES